MVFDKYKEFKNFAENQTGHKIKSIRTDNGREYCNEAFMKHLREFGDDHEKSAPYAQQQNGKSERLNRSLTEKARCMLFDNNLEANFWAEAVCAAAHVLNRSPSRCVVDKIPEEIWSGKRPDVSHIRVFGCKAMMMIPKQKRTKLEPKSLECIMVGYAQGSKAYRLFDPVNRRIHISRDVVFQEHEVIDRSRIKSNHFYFYLDEVDNGNEVKDVADISNDNIETINLDPADDDNVDSSQDRNRSHVGSVHRDNESTIITLESSDNDSFYDDPRDESYVPDEPVLIPDQQRRSERLNYIEASDMATVNQALAGPNKSNWQQAMKDEYKSLIANNTWTLVDLPAGRKPITNKWVFQTKHDSDGVINRYKARLVIRGCAQRKGIDYEETFSPVVRYTSIRFLLGMAAKFDLDMDQMDAETAFLHGELDEEIYMAQPEGFQDGTSKVCRLNKSLYGLKQASKVWNQKLDAALREFGLTRSKTDACIYYFENGNKMYQNGGKMYQSGGKMYYNGGKMYQQNITY